MAIFRIGERRTKRLQRQIDWTLGHRGFPWRKVPVDGVRGPETHRAAGMAAWLQGFSSDAVRAIYNGKINRWRFFVLTHQWARTAAMKQRDQNRRDRARKLIEAHKADQAGVQFKGTSPGDPHWSGSRYVIEEKVIPVAYDLGVPVTSLKRYDTLGNPSSDHYVGNITAYAADLGTYSGEALANAIAKSLGIEGYSTGNYNSYYVTFGGMTFRVQILWAVSGHYDHVHVGVRRV